MTKFSIIIPVYNVERYLKQCFESVLNQNYTIVDEVIIDKKERLL